MSNQRDALQIAKAIINLYQSEIGDTISNLKLQKLLYYAQGFHLAAFGEPLFPEKIYAWQYGPVVREVYREFKGNGSGSIESRFDVDLAEIIPDEEQRELFLEVNKIYGQYSALRLMDMTHNEPPWASTNIDNEITHDKLKDYFVTRLK